MPKILAKPVTDLAGLHDGIPALVLGNSPWRDGFPLHAWAGITIGCNAAYREHVSELDYLCTVDRRIMKEIIEQGVFQKINKHGSKVGVVISQIQNWPRGMQGLEEVYTAQPIPDKGCPGLPWQRLAGDMACALADMMGCNPIILLGHSLDGTNLYHHTYGYQQRGTRPGKKDPGTDRRFVDVITKRLDALRLHGKQVFWIAPGGAMLELIERSAPKPNAKRVA